MTTFAEFERKLKAVVRRTPPDNVGNWTRYLSGGVPELEEFIEELCHAFLRGDLSHREAVAEFLTADDDVLWFTARFISEQARTVKGVADCGPLLRPPTPEFLSHRWGLPVEHRANCTIWLIMRLFIRSLP